MDNCIAHPKEGEGLKVNIRPIQTETDRLLFAMALGVLRGWVEEIVMEKRRQG